MKTVLVVFLIFALLALTGMTFFLFGIGHWGWGLVAGVISMACFSSIAKLCWEVPKH